VTEFYNRDTLPVTWQKVGYKSSEVIK